MVHYKSRTFSAILKGHEALQRALTEITNAPTGWKEDTISQAYGLLQNLESFLFCFLLELYYKILEQSSILYNILQSRSTDFAYGVSKIKKFVDFLLTNLRNDVAYEACYAAAEARADGPSGRSEQIINYKQLYNEVIDTIASMIKNRLKDVESFS